MGLIKINYYEVFTDQLGKGNMAGVVFDADWLTEEERLEVAKNTGVPETIFILHSEKADCRLRFHTPEQEISLSLYGTIAALYELLTGGKTAATTQVTIETLEGIFNAQYNKEREEVYITLPPAEFIHFNGDVNLLATSIRIMPEDIDDRYPIVYGSTGSWTLILPIKNVQTFLRMFPEHNQFATIMEQVSTASINPICLETYDKTCSMHGRHFSTLKSRNIEDPVIGTTAGVMGAYYITYVNQLDQVEIKMEQGYEIGRKSFVHVVASRSENKTKVSILGRAIYIDSIELEI